MKTMKKGDTISRIKEDDVDKYLRMGYSFVPKSVYKKEFKPVEKTTDGEADPENAELVKQIKKVKKEVTKNKK